MANIVLIVDPFSTGKLYATQFQQLGYDCYAVLSSLSVPEFFQKSAGFSSFKHKKFLSVDEVKQQFTPNQVKAVVVGAETGLFVGEQLAHYFQVKGNNPLTSHLRRDKFAMQQQLKQAGLNYIDTEIIYSAEKLPEFKTHSAYVVKPLNFAGTEGEEFVVDMVVDQQQIFTVSLCRYRKGEHNGSRFVYEHMEMLDPNAVEFAELIHYAHQCTRALGFEFGPVHMELMRTAESKVVMIEAGGRLHGGVAPTIFQQCYQPDLLTQAVSSYHKNAIPSSTKQIKFARVVFMINDKANAKLAHSAFLHAIKQLPSFYDVVISQENPLALTVDLLTCPVFVLLVSTTESQIEQDEQRLRRLFSDYLH